MDESLYYNIPDGEIEDPSSIPGIEVHEGESAPAEGPCIKYDFSKHVLVELLDNVTPEYKLWKALGLLHNKDVMHKRLLLDPHRVNCRRAIVVCTNSDAASDMAKRLSQAKIMLRAVCAVVIQELLSDLHLFEKQIIQYGDKGSQQQLVFVTDLNRNREPASLARYLREKFSPFGTILSVLVAEGEDGYALPEGVIRFAHLSEAFAAELAYDQCAVALERLSVTTHHNILLSQRDLKTRLKKAQLEYSKNFDGEVTSAKSVSKNPESDIETEKHNSSTSSVTSEIFQPLRRQISPTTEILEQFPTDSEELADVLQSSCKDNLVDCLKEIAGSETGYTASVASGLETQVVDKKLPSDSSPASSAVAAPSDKSWSARVMGWISEIPNADEMARYPDWGEQRLSNGSNGDQAYHSNACPGEHENENLQLPGMDIPSTSGSFVTCRNGDPNTSLNSYLSLSPVKSPRGEEPSSNDVTLQPDACSSSVSDAGEHHLESLNVEEDIGPVAASLKRKNSSLMTQKLSIKKLNSSQALSDISETDTTLQIPSAFQARQCYVLLDRLPELTENVDTFKSPVVPGPSTSSNTKVKVASSQKSRRRANSTVTESSNPEGGSVRSLPVRRNARRALRQDQKQKTSSVSGESAMVTTESAPDPVEEVNQNEPENPIRLWLKKELRSSSKKDAKKDVHIPVGCSHMTCDFCYPESTKLLLGCH